MTLMDQSKDLTVLLVLLYNSEVCDVGLVAKKQAPAGEEIWLRETNWINQKRIHWIIRTVEISMQRSEILIF